MLELIDNKISLWISLFYCVGAITTYVALRVFQKLSDIDYNHYRHNNTEDVITVIIWPVAWLLVLFKVCTHFGKLSLDHLADKIYFYINNKLNQQK